MTRSAGLLALALVGACEDQLPTANGEGRFPDGLTPSTLEIVLGADAFLLSDTVYDGYATARDAGFLLVAEDFDGVFDAHSLARLTGFPDSVNFTVSGVSRNDTLFTYGAGRVVTTVSNAVSASAGPATLRLYALDQRFDSATVTWDTAGVFGGVTERWRTPGGTAGRLLAETTWTPGDTAVLDTIGWNVDSLTVAALARAGANGLLVTSATPGSRVQIGRLSLETAVRPAARPDTVIARTIAAGPQAFVYTPREPATGSAYRVGGPGGARTVLGVNLAQRVRGCPVTFSGTCPDVPLRDVTLNRAVLLLRPLAVPSGFRPLGASTLRVRRVVEPELGRLAPLGEAFASDSIGFGIFQNPGSSEVEIDLTAAVANVLATDSSTATLALLGDAVASQFGFLSFAERPRLRLVYTLPLRPQLP